MDGRRYQNSHPWISFELNLKRVSHLFWLLLGEAQSKCLHIAGVPLPDSVYEQLHKSYLAKGVLATTSIEGNTLTEKEVLDQLEGKLNLPPSKEYMRQEVQNILDACNEIGQMLEEASDKDITIELILRFNYLVLKGLSVDSDVKPGVIRDYSVGVGNYRAAPAEDCEYLLHRLVDWLNEFNLVKLPKIVNALLKAVLAHLYIAWIHPFGDGNGRTARLLEFYILFAAGVPTPVTHLLSNHYNQTRSQYYRMLNEARQNPLSFLEYATEGFIDGLKEQLKIIRDFQWDLTWRDHVNDVFEGKERPSDLRRLHLLLDLANYKKFVPLADVTQISPRAAVDYNRVTAKTLSRDLAYLTDLGLIEIKKEHVRARREIVLRFLPLGNKDDIDDEFVPLIVDRFPLDIPHSL